MADCLALKSFNNDNSTEVQTDCHWEWLTINSINKTYVSREIINLIEDITSCCPDFWIGYCERLKNM